MSSRIRFPTRRLTRRQALARLLATSAVGAAAPLQALSAPTSARPLRVTQLLDSSADQQELSRDYSTGIRLALAERARTGAASLQLSTLTVDGSAASLEQALRAVKDDAGQLALLGTVGEKLALDSIAMSRQIGLDIAHLAPWLADTSHDASNRVFPLFASRDAQIRQALQSLASVGVAELGLVYASPALEQALRPGVMQATERLGLKARRFAAAPSQELSAFGEAFPAASPVVLLFLGGTVELALFSQGLSRRGLQRYVVCLSDVDVTTLMQLGPGRAVPLIFTQVVPNPQSSSLPLVRGYRAALKEFYDEAPSPLSLAGYVAGRYAVQALAGLDAGASRGAVLTELQRRPAIDLGGVQIRFGSDGRGSSYVNQTLLQSNGKLIG